MRASGHPTLAVTCRGDSPLATGADVTLVSPAGDEAAIVMTRSFASMLALLLAVVAALGGATRSSRRTCGAFRSAGPRRPRPRTSGGGSRRATGRGIVILGGGPAIGIAAEWGLKLTETSQVPTSGYEPLEFRHGPISVCEPGVLGRRAGRRGGRRADEAAVVARRRNWAPRRG
jgi:glucosamine--fructose-6-phosphate aminotransferase (isomerizing)